MNLSKDIINAYLDKKLISMQKHPDTDLYILNYTPKCQYDKLWDGFTKQCRGLIIDDKGNIKARPFSKFFNIEEHQPEEIPNEPFIVTVKEDGSLGITYWIGNKPFIATRGSFTSPQAIKANEMIKEKYSNNFNNIIKYKDEFTFLWEIIFKENRIVFIRH